MGLVLQKVEAGIDPQGLHASKRLLRMHCRHDAVKSTMNEMYRT